MGLGFRVEWFWGFWILGLGFRVERFWGFWILGFGFFLGLELRGFWETKDTGCKLRMPGAGTPE